MQSRSFCIVREGDDDPAFVPDEIDTRRVLAYRVDGQDVSRAEYECAHAEWHTDPAEF